MAYHDFKASGFTVVGNGYDDVSTDARLFEAEMIVCMKMALK